MHALVAGLLASWTSIGGSPQIATVWKLITICVLWYLWQEQNEWTFVDNERSMEEFRSFFVNTVFFWVLAIDFNGLNLHDFLSSFSVQ